MAKTVTERVKEIVVSQLGVEASEVVEGASFNKDLGADSLDRIEVMMAFEEEFHIEISDADAERIETIAQAIAYVEGKKGAAA